MKNLLIVVMAYALIASFWAFNSHLVLMGLLAHIRNQGGHVNQALFYTGSSIISLSAVVGLISGQWIRRHKSVKTSIALGLVIFLITAAIGFLLVAVAILSLKGSLG